MESPTQQTKLGNRNIENDFGKKEIIEYVLASAAFLRLNYINDDIRHGNPR